MKPPINSRITGLPRPAAASLCVRTSASGNAKNGISEVAGMGMVSVTHQVAVSRVIAAVTAIRYSIPE